MENKKCYRCHKILTEKDNYTIDKDRYGRESYAKELGQV